MKQKLTRRELGEVRDDRTDWKRLAEQSEEDLAEAIRNDPDDEELEPDWVERAMLVEPSPPKERITMWVDADVLEWFRSQGRGYQTRLNAVLRAFYEEARSRRR